MNKIRLLIVDDSSAMRKMVERSLRSAERHENPGRTRDPGNLFCVKFRVRPADIAEADVRTPKPILAPTEN